MTTSYEHPSNGYRVQVSDGACFLWTLLFGGLFFLVRGNVRHFFIGFILGACTFGISWLIYPFFASGILRTMYMERGYREVHTPEPESSGSSAFALIFLLLLAGGGAFWWFHVRPNQVAGTPSPSVAAQSVAAPQFATVAEAQREAIRLYPALGVAGSEFNRAFLARHKQYQQQRPDFLRDPSWPLRLAEEIAPPADPQNAISSTSLAASGLCYGIEKTVNGLATFTNTMCIPAKGLKPGTISFTILSEKPVFSTSSKKGWLLVVVAAVGNALNENPSVKTEELCLTDVSLVKDGKAYVIDAAIAKSLQQQIKSDKITLEQMYATITRSLTLKTVKKQ